MSIQDDENLDSTKQAQQDSDNSGNDTPPEATTPADDVDTLKQQLAQRDEQNRKLYERAKKAEQKLKSQTVNQPPNPNSQEERDELRLVAQGMSDEEIKQAKIIAKGAGVSLSEAIKDPLFTTFQDKLKDEKRKEEAKLHATKGSRQTSEESDIKPYMSREDHKAVWEKSVKR